KYYENFIANVDTISRKLINNIYVIDNSANIVDTAPQIQKELLFSCKQQHIPLVFERLEGWWINKAIEALTSTRSVYINTRQVASYIVDISQEYSHDNLPIDIDGLNIDLDSLSFEGKLFYEQLKLIGT